MISFLKRREFLGRGLVALEEEEGDFFEGGVVGEVVDLVAAVDELVLLDGADRGLAADDAFKAAGERGGLVGSGRGGRVLGGGGYVEDSGWAERGWLWKGEDSAGNATLGRLRGCRPQVWDVSE